MAGKSLPQQQLHSVVGEMDFGTQLAISTTDLKFSCKTLTLGKLLIRFCSLRVTAALMIPKSPSQYQPQVDV